MMMDPVLDAHKEAVGVVISVVWPTGCMSRLLGLIEDGQKLC